MRSKTMNRKTLFAWLAAAAVALAGCTAPLPQGIAPGDAQGQGATLALNVDWGRQVQALPEDVTGATVSIQVNGRMPIIRSFGRTTWATESVDISGLPGGDALVRVEAYHDQQKIGEGQQGLPLVIGRRTFARISVGLDSTGRTDQLPMTPLGPMPDPAARIVMTQLLFNVASGSQVLQIVNHTGQPITNFNAYHLVYQPAEATDSVPSPILDQSSFPVSFLDTEATISVSLSEYADFSRGQFRTVYASGSVQPGGGALALVRDNMNQPPTMVDFVQWGGAGSMLEQEAVSKGLWDYGQSLPYLDPTGYDGFRYFVLKPGDRGFYNWNYAFFPQPPAL